MTFKSISNAIALPVSCVAFAACFSDVPTQVGPPHLDAMNSAVQYGNVGAKLDDAFMVRVTDNHAHGMRGVVIEWRVTTGSGDLVGDRAGASTSVTDAAGFASITLRPTIRGTIIVTAQAPTLPGSSVAFRASARPRPDVVIHVEPGYDCGYRSTFRGPDGTSDVTVPVGAIVEWVFAESVRIWPCAATIRSTSVPVNATTFDQYLEARDRFQFTPLVVGTWDFADVVNGGRGTLTAVVPD